MIDLLAYIGGVFAMISFFPQILKALVTKSTNDISWLMLVTTLISVVAYEIYAIALGLVPVIIMNAIFLVTIIVMVSIKYRYDGPYHKLKLQSDTVS